MVQFSRVGQWFADDPIRVGNIFSQQKVDESYQQNIFSRFKPETWGRWSKGKRKHGCYALKWIEITRHRHIPGTSLPSIYRLQKFKSAFHQRVLSSLSSLHISSIMRSTGFKKHWHLSSFCQFILLIDLHPGKLGRWQRIFNPAPFMDHRSPNVIGSRGLNPPVILRHLFARVYGSMHIHMIRWCLHERYLHTSYISTWFVIINYTQL